MKPAPTPLTCKTLELLVAYRHNPSIRLRNKIVTLNLGLVRKIAHGIKSQCKEPYADLEQVGSLGLIRAVERFDPSKGAAFSSFAVPYIRGEMLHYLRDKGSLVRVPRCLQDLYRESQRFTKQFSALHGRNPSDAEIIDGLNISPLDWRDTLAAISNRSPASLDTSDCQEVEELPEAVGMVIEWLDEPEQPAIAPLDPVAYLGSSLSEIDQPDNVIHASFIRNEPRKAIAEAHNVSSMTVRRRIQSGLVQLSDARRRKNIAA